MGGGGWRVERREDKKNKAAQNEKSGSYEKSSGAAAKMILETILIGTLSSLQILCSSINVLTCF